MKLRFALLLLALLFCPFGLVAEEGNPALKQAAEVLAPVFKKLDPKAEIGFTNDGTTLTVNYLTQTYKIHNRSKTGEVFATTRDETGPSFKGFVLKVHLQGKGEVNQAATPQTLREPYWQTDLDVTPVGKTPHQIYWALLYGSRTDAKLLAEIREALRGLK